MGIMAFSCLSSRPCLMPAKPSLAPEHAKGQDHPSLAVTEAFGRELKDVRLARRLAPRPYGVHPRVMEHARHPTSKSCHAAPPARPRLSKTEELDPSVERYFWNP